MGANDIVQASVPALGLGEGLADLVTQGLMTLLLSLAAGNMLVRVPAAHLPRARLIWLAGAAVVGGYGCWTLDIVDLIQRWGRTPLRLDGTQLCAALALSVAGMMAAFYLLLAADCKRPAARILSAGPAFGLTLAMVQALILTGVRGPSDIALGPGPLLGMIALAALPSILAAACVLRADTAAGLLGCALFSFCALQLVHGGAVRGAVRLAPAPQGPFDLGPAAILTGAVVGACGIIAIFTFVSGIKDRELELRSEEETARLRQFKEAALEGIAIHRHGRILDCNGALRQLLEQPGDDIIGAQIDAVLGTEARALAATGEHPMEISLPAPGGGHRSLEILTRPLDFDGRPALVTAVRDITARKRAEARVHFLAHHDGLTGLSNRTALEEELERTIELAGWAGRATALLYLDLDGFKLVNDLLGHAAGDEVLQAVAARLSKLVRATDFLARLGGDEFVIVQPLARQPHDAEGLARRVIAALAKPFDIGGNQTSIGGSIGISLAVAGASTTPARMLHEADLALYRAKQTGRNTFCFFEPGMDAELRARRSMEQELRRAIGTSQFRLVYQPQYSSEGRLRGFEALLRWQHPVRGAISPAEFIPVAEETGLIAPLGEWVLHAACGQAATLPGDLTMAVNLSPVQFRRPDLAGTIRRALEEAGLPAHRLELELTETVFLQDKAEVRCILDRLKAQGVRLALDDFGSGYSSLNYLRDFPFDRLKIDRSFVGLCTTDERMVAIVNAMVELGHALGLEVLMEGVETRAELDLLRQLGGDLMQGFLFGRPVEALQIPALTAAATAAAAFPAAPELQVAE